MAKLTFKAGSTPLKLHTHFASGKSITYDEAYRDLNIRNLAQRIKDLSLKFDDAGIESPLMVFDEPKSGGGTHARYFYRGFGCALENRPGVRKY